MFFYDHDELPFCFLIIMTHRLTYSINNEIDLSIYKMILNENYFDDLKLTDEDIESSDSTAISNNNEYATPEEWFADMKSRYTYCIEIPLSQDYQWKWDLQLILKRLFYVFDTYGIEYSEPTLQEYAKRNFRNNYFKCNFIDYNKYKLILNYKTLEEVNNSGNDISVVIFFNLPEEKTYKNVCKFVSSILSYIQNDRIKDLTYGYFLVWNFVREAYAKYFSEDCTIAESDIISIITLFFPEKSATIRRELYADDAVLLSKLLRCFA